MLLFTAGLFAAVCSVAAAATKDVQIIVTHSGAPGQVITTVTIFNGSGSATAPNTPYIGGQGFRRGDIPSGSYPVIRDAGNHGILTHQWDELGTRRENGDDGSLRHAVFSILVPVAVPGNGTYTFEIVRQSGKYPVQPQRQSLATLAASHALNIVLSDVRNQDLSPRLGGALKFDINTAAHNTGRDAPEKCATGSVRDCWIVKGPLLNPAGVPDPLLWAKCFVDLTTLPDRVTLGPVRHICSIHNSWMNVATELSGNAGAPGRRDMPKGLAGDPQAISYRPQLLDGNKNLLDWSWMDASVSSASNPVVTGLASDSPGVAQSCSRGTSNGLTNGVANGNIVIPTSTGDNVWPWGMATWYTTSGTPPAGMTNSHLYFVYPSGLPYSSGHPALTQQITLTEMPSNCLQAGLVPMVLPTNQGVGTHNFSYRAWHTHWMGLYTSDQYARENWTNGTSRAVSPFTPAMTRAEQLYWQETGIVPPLKIGSPTANPTNTGVWLTSNYTPMARGNIIGGSGTGPRSDIGVVNEYSAQAFLSPSPITWQRARVFALSAIAYAWGNLLNEATGRIPVVNNGPPSGNHNGVGNSYSELGAPHPRTYILDPATTNNVATPLFNVPNKTGSATYGGGIWSGTRTYGNDHEPAFQTLIYAFLGSRHLLDALHQAGNRAVWANYSDGTPDGRWQFSDHAIAGVHYWGLVAFCCEARGAAWGYRDIAAPAALGGDDRQERAYFNDILHENYYYEQAFDARLDGGGSIYRNSLETPQHLYYTDTYIDSYIMQAGFVGWQMLHDPWAGSWFPRFTSTYVAHCADTVPNHLSSYYCASFWGDDAVRDASRLMTTGDAGLINIGTAYGGSANDASEVGLANWVRIPARSPTAHQVEQIYPMTNGDTIKFIGCRAQMCDTSIAPNEISYPVWYRVRNVDNNAHTFEIENPATPGVSFPSFTGPMIDGATLITIKQRPRFTGSGWYSGYSIYAQPLMYALHILGFSAIDPAIATMSARGFHDPGPKDTNLNWDPSVAVR